MVFNYIVIVFLIVIVVVVLYGIFRTEENYIEEITDSQVYSIEYLAEGVKSVFNGILRADVAELNLNKHETKKREQSKGRLRTAIRTCSKGDKGAKKFIKEYIKEILQKKYSITEETIDHVISFTDSSLLSIQEKYEILLHIYKKKYKNEAMVKLIEKYHLDELKEGEDGYDICKKDFESIYEKEKITLSFSDKLEIVSQFIYMVKFGNSVVDSLLDMNIDGVSGGVSGIPDGFYTYDDEILFEEINRAPKSYESVWTFIKGNTTHLSFLSFGNQKELERVCKNIYNNGKVGQLSERDGYKVSDLPNGSRVTVLRPPLSESWCFLVRNHMNIKIAEITEIIKEEGAEIPINILECLVRGQQVLAITGPQGCGKTTLFKSMIRFINPTFTIRLFEEIFELALRKLHSFKNIITVRNLDSVSVRNVLATLRRTDGNVSMIGEVTTAEQTNYVVKIAKVSDLTMFTSHHITTDALIQDFTIDLLDREHGSFNNEKAAEQKVVNAINFDIHMDKTDNGLRYLERITEIVPVIEKEYPENIKEAMREYFRRMTDKETYKAVDIVVLENGRYILKNDLSEQAKRKILKHLDPELADKFTSLFSIFNTIKVGDVND